MIPCVFQKLMLSTQLRSFHGLGVPTLRIPSAFSIAGRGRLVLEATPNTRHVSAETDLGGDMHYTDRHSQSLGGHTALRNSGVYFAYNPEGYISFGVIYYLLASYPLPGVNPNFAWSLGFAQGRCAKIAFQYLPPTGHTWRVGSRIPNF
ncbi:hypothetical protein MLPF_0707 [Mycobacterium lepromatosis]|nr:hypothetical protein MLPF_0707 [Mycobacterium lepromatosis]